MSSVSLGDHERVVREHIKNGKPGEALVYLAAALDSRVEVRAADPWALSDSEPVAPADDEWTEEKGRANYEAELQRIGPDPGGDDSASWKARRDIARDLLAQPTPDIGILVAPSQVQAVDDIVELPPPNEKQIAIRKALVTHLNLDQENWHKPSIPPCADAFMRGGPLYLYLAYRDYCEGLPPAIIQQMVADIAQSSEPDARNMALDLLKQTDDASHAAAAAADPDAWFGSHRA